MSSNYAELRDKKVKEIEEILKSYLPEQNGYQRIIMDAMEYSLMAGRQASASDADAGDLPIVWWNRKGNRAVYGSAGDDTYLFTGTR